jgi:exo-beta-1,3-glucanase (GH17 family)
VSRISPLLPPILLLLAGLMVLAWWWPNRPRAGDVAMPDARFNSVSFAPFRAGQSPLDHRFPSAAEVAEDMAVIAPRTRAIRTYAAIEGDYDVAALAAKHGLKVWQGIWLGTDRAKNAAEIARGIALANRYPEAVERVVVGNEVLLRRDLPVGELIAAIDQVRAAVRQPVTYADVWEFWRQFPEVAPHVDVVTIHLLPYWEDKPTGIDGAVQHVDAVYRAMAKLFRGKPIAIGETGWPSRGRARQDATPGRVEQAVFLRRFIALARAEGFDYNLIEAFDQGWKYQSEGTVGANWGLWTADRKPKFPLSGPVAENPDWRRYAAGSVAGGLGLLTLALCCRSPRRTADQLRLAILAMALGGALAFAWAGTVPVIYDARLLVAAIGNLAGQALLAVLMMRRAADILSGTAASAARTGADATETVLALLRLRPGRRITGASLFDDLSFVFVWTAAVMQLLLLFDPRYRDFPLPVFAVPLICVVARAALADLPRGGSGREELWAGGTLAIAAVVGAVAAGPAHFSSLAGSIAALVLAAPPLLRVARRDRVPATA